MNTRQLLITLALSAATSALALAIYDHYRQPSIAYLDVDAWLDAERAAYVTGTLSEAQYRARLADYLDWLSRQPGIILKSEAVVRGARRLRYPGPDIPTTRSDKEP
ncbi:MAG TPA: hypothetical protein VK971_13625 [Thiohalobacter sp.]|nr:hypothetical protein [Thiohalobacter sp.]